jgi:hypothetical protein
MQATQQYTPPLLLGFGESEFNVAGAAEKIAALEERVANHIKFFWVVVGFGFVWLGALTVLINQINGAVNRLERTQTAALVDLNNRVVAAQLTGLRTAIETAHKKSEIIPKLELADYKQTLQKSPSSSAGYWATLAALINYQSFINQLNGEAPDPSTVSKPCPMVAGPMAHDNTFSGFAISGCIVDLDTETFENITFRNSVIRYRGGPVSLLNVRFINCRFILDVPANPVLAPTSSPARLLLALLNSPDQKNVQVSTKS